MDVKPSYLAEEEPDVMEAGDAPDVPSFDDLDSFTEEDEFFFQQLDFKRSRVARKQETLVKPKSKPKGKNYVKNQAIFGDV